MSPSFAILRVTNGLIWAVTEGDQEVQIYHCLPAHEVHQTVLRTVRAQVKWIYLTQDVPVSPHDSTWTETSLELMQHQHLYLLNQLHWAQTSIIQYNTAKLLSCPTQKLQHIFPRRRGKYLRRQRLALTMLLALLNLPWSHLSLALRKKNLLFTRIYWRNILISSSNT